MGVRLVVSISVGENPTVEKAVTDIASVKMLYMTSGENVTWMVPKAMVFAAVARDTVDVSGNFGGVVVKVLVHP